ncbi:hypothetical protein WN72_43855 [Bradyrhizobium arachidis]|uniref:Uncharacterized protein n=1 Tax=Bradyrhizobium arachidis TaxID=858423 RepID=A0AAE7NZP8_9BRAD|nr:hypothetical protein WN72_43855 [Bradyrhizobium arachidis]
MRWCGSRGHRGRRRSSLSFRGARSASPESILPIGVMDSGLDAARRPGMTSSNCYSQDFCL